LVGYGPIHLSGIDAKFINCQQDRSIKIVVFAHPADFRRMVSDFSDPAVD